MNVYENSFWSAEGWYIQHTCTYVHHSTRGPQNLLQKNQAISTLWTESIAEEELKTPDPTSIPDDILIYLTVTSDEAKAAYHSDLDTHVTSDMQTEIPQIMTLLKSQLAYDVFIPTVWTGITMEPYRLVVKPGLPEYMKAHTRPVRTALYLDAKKGFDRMKTYF